MLLDSKGRVSPEVEILLSKTHNKYNAKLNCTLLLERQNRSTEGCSKYRFTIHFFNIYILCIHFSPKSVHLIINASVTMVCKRNYYQSVHYCVLCREFCPLFNHVKYYRKSEIVVAKMTKI